MATTTDIGSLLQRAQAAQRAGRYPEAAEHLEAVLAVAPAQPQALNALGVMALDTGAYGRAVAFFRRATESDPKADILWMNLAKAHRLCHDDEAEKVSLQAALELDQANLGAVIRIAELHQRSGRTADAVQYWRRALGLAAGLDDEGAGLKAVLDDARGFVGQHDRGFAGLIEAQMTGPLETLSTTSRRRFDACIDHMFGRRKIYVNQCEGGIHYPFLPADEFFDRNHFEWLPVLEARTAEIRAEAERLLVAGGTGFVPYVTQMPGTPANKWTALDGSGDWGAYYLWKYGERIDPACAACPATAAIVDALPLPRIPGRMPTAFFSLLRPRTRLPAHTGVTNTRAVIHLPLIVPEGCGFRVGGEVRKWREGEAFAFDDTIEHEAWNDSDQPRVVLILDTWNPHLAQDEQLVLQRFFEAADASGFRPETEIT